MNGVYYMSRVQFFAILGSVVLILFLFWLIRRRRLLAEYSLLWLGVFTVFLVIAVFGGLLDEMARFFGILYPPATIFILLIIGIIMLLLHFSTIISELKRKLNELSVRLALLENQSRAGEKRGSVGRTGAEPPSGGPAAPDG
ncbi:MAG: DUF2304 domain-containing protein [Candidatus Krumholzibacteria bacterium]|nr:DUF2304 domain-containing protein [Candidatus Krumholzibacteria bacterium]